MHAQIYRAMKVHASASISTEHNKSWNLQHTNIKKGEFKGEKFD